MPPAVAPYNATSEALNLRASHSWVKHTISSGLVVISTLINSSFSWSFIALTAFVYLETTKSFNKVCLINPFLVVNNRLVLSSNLEIIKTRISFSIGEIVAILLIYEPTSFILHSSTLKIGI